MLRKYIYLFIFICTVFLFSCSQENPVEEKTVLLNNEQVFVTSFRNGMYPSLVYKSCIDTVVNEMDPKINYEIASSFYATQLLGVVRSLFKFDLGGYVPSNINIKKASLTLYLNYSSADIAVECYELSTGWIGSEVTWNESKSGTSWTTLGGDYGKSKIISTIIAEDDSKYITFDIPACIVQKWIDDPSENNGLIFKFFDETVSSTFTTIKIIQFASSEAEVQYRPMLTVYYTY